MTDPTDETQPHPVTDPTTAGDAATESAGSAAADGRAGSSPAASPSASPPPAVDPPLQADPNRPADSGWREPPWFPPRERARDGRSSVAAVVVGLALIGIGVWFFLDRTLGLSMPRIQWSTVWPVILIVIGALIVLRSFQRNAR